MYSKIKLKMSATEAIIQIKDMSSKLLIKTNIKEDIQ